MAIRRNAKTAKTATPETAAPEAVQPETAAPEAIQPETAAPEAVIIEPVSFPVTVTVSAGSPFAASYGNPVDIDVTKAGKGRYIARFQPETEGPTHQGVESKTVATAIKSLVTDMGFNPKVVQDLAFDEPQIGHNAPEEAMPWEEGDNADRLKSLASDVNENVDRIMTSERMTRDAYLSIAASLVAAQDIVASWSANGSGRVALAVWGRYVEQFFPNIKRLGKNTVSEAIALGRAPESVLAHWPESQNSPKAFSGWSRNLMGLFADIAASGFIHAFRDHHAKAAPGDAPLPMPTDAEIAQAIKDAVTLAEERAEKSLKAGGDIHAQDKAVAAIGAWKAGDMPDDPEARAKTPLFKAVKRLVAADHAEHVQSFDPDARVAAETEKASKAISAFREGFSEKPVDVAARHLLNILVAHPEAEAVYEALGDLLRMREEAAEKKADAAEEDADREMSGE